MTKITNRSQLIYALTEAAELEHMIMCQYLFAAASLKSSPQELPNAPRRYHQFELIRSWKKFLLQVAREEMQHLTYVINLLVSVGGTPTFSRPNFPNRNRFYKSPDGEQEHRMSLEKFDLETIKRFISFETAPLSQKEKYFAGIPDPNYYESLHEFYSAIKDAFEIDGMFVDYEDQYDPVVEKLSVKVGYRKAIPNVVKNAQQAEDLISLIIEQGEGASANDQQAHAAIFDNILKEYEQERQYDPQFEPARNVACNPMTRHPDDLEDSLRSHITVVDDKIDSLAYTALQLFNKSYEVLLTWMHQAFNRHGSKEELLAIESLAFMPYMSEVIRPLMELLTRIPVSNQQATVPGKQQYLGAGFEVTSNNFLIPKPQVTYHITIERLSEMEKLCSEISSELTSGNFGDIVKDDFLFIKDTISLLKKEFETRVKDGWPHTNLDLSNSESLDLTKAAVITPDLVGSVEWNLRGPDILQLDFQGWFLTWLAGDPDSANERRGIAGNNFVLGDEPDFDRVLYLRDDKKLQRSHCPDIGVKVIKASIIKAPMDLNIVEREVAQFVGAEVLLLNNPKFEGRTHIVAGNGEPIDPFEISIQKGNEIKLTRAVVGSGEINEMKSAQRAGSGRYVKDPKISLAEMQIFLQKINKDYRSPQDYLAQRIMLLEEDLKEYSSDNVSCEAEKLRFRLKCLKETKNSSQGKRVPGFIRWERFFFSFGYSHTISGKEIMPLECPANLGFAIKPLQENDVLSKWVINYKMGFFDSDALSGFMYGALKIPIDLTGNEK